MQTDQRKLPSVDVEQTELRRLASSDDPQQREVVAGATEDQLQQKRTDFQETTEQPIYIMVPKLYSESVSLRDDGPLSTTQYSSSCIYKTPQTYITHAAIVPRLIPKYYITMVRVDGETEEDIVTYHERVEFVYTLRIKEFSETVKSFPKEVSNSFVTTLTYVPNHTHRHYVTSLVMEPAQLMKLPVRDDDFLTTCSTENETAAICNGKETNARLAWEQEGTACEMLNGTV